MNYVFLNINYLLKNKVIWCVKLRKFVNVKNISGVSVVLANKAWLSPFKWSNYPVNTTPPFVNDTWIDCTWQSWVKEKEEKKKTKSFTFCTSRRGWDEDTFEPSIAYYIGINWKIFIFTFKKVQFSSIHWKGIVDRQMFWICFYSSSWHKKEISST